PRSLRHLPLPSFPTRRSSDLSAIDPCDQGSEVGFRQAAVVREGAVMRVGKPWRHLALHHGFLDRLGPGTRLLIGDERHGSGLARSEEHTSELQSLAYLVCRLL